MDLDSNCVRLCVALTAFVGLTHAASLLCHSILFRSSTDLLLCVMMPSLRFFVFCLVSERSSKIGSVTGVDSNRVSQWCQSVDSDELVSASFGDQHRCYQWRRGLEVGDQRNGTGWRDMAWHTMAMR
uniref:Uncharacterized protein n=1 Tax=Craspedostauros australis TaxID=1486917 RepID=A0A7R9WXH8_9STRA